MLKQTQKIDFQKTFVGFFYGLVLAVSILLFLFALNLGLKNFETGRDLEVFCRASKVITNGGNPYLTSELGLELSWNYPSIMAYGFYPPCLLLGFEQNYILFYILFFIAGLLIWLQKKDWLYGIVLCTTGLFNLGWVMITGNISTIEFLLFSISIFLLLRNKLKASAFLFGLMASIKLVPILYLPAFLFLQNDLKKKIATVAWSVIGFLSLALLSLISSPHLFGWYLRQLFGLIPNQHTPFSEFTANGLNPSFSIMLFSFLGIEAQTEKIGLSFSLAIYALGIFIFYFIFKLIKSIGFDNKLILFSLAIIILTIFMPRLKPYSFLPALLCFYLISKEQNNFLKSLHLVLLSIMPTFLHLIYFYTENNDILFASISPAFFSNALQTILTFHQIFFLSIASILLISSTMQSIKSLQQKTK